MMQELVDRSKQTQNVKKKPNPSASLRLSSTTLKIPNYATYEPKFFTTEEKKKHGGINPEQQ
uniref:Uncharacterized protein n=1 Tax=Rhizophora mucronata TaxID=61149 RepID=A0A2P2P512_RHIMU